MEHRRGTLRHLNRTQITGTAVLLFLLLESIFSPGGYAAHQEGKLLTAVWVVAMGVHFIFSVKPFLHAAGSQHRRRACSPPTDTKSRALSPTLALSILLLLNKMSLSASFLSWQLPPDRRHGNKKPPRAEVSGELPVLPSVLHPNTNRVTRSRRVWVRESGRILGGLVCAAEGLCPAAAACGSCFCLTALWI